MAKAKLKKLYFKAEDVLTGKVKNVGYCAMRIRNADEEPEEPEPFAPGAEEPEEEPEEPAVDLYFYGDIGGAAWETDYFEEDKCPQDVLNFFNEIPENAPVNVYMNSGGGDAYAGIAISNMIARHKGKTTGHIDGLAASIASVIVSGCDKVIIHRGGQFMVHKPLTIAMGNANDFKDTIKRLDACQDCITDVYMKHVKAGVTRDTITKLINAETWLSAGTVTKYFNFETDEESEPKAAAKSAYYNRYKNLPKNLQKKPESNAGFEEKFLAAMDLYEKRKQQQEEADILADLDKYGI